MDTIKETLLQIAKAENIKIDDKTLTIISKKADGALRDAESYLDQVVSFCGDKIDSETVAKMLNLIDDEIYFEISDAILNKNFKSVFEVTNKIYGNGWDFIDFMEGLIEHFRNIMTVVLTEKTSLTVLFKPEAKNAYANAIWNTPRKLTIQISENVIISSEARNGMHTMATIIFPQNMLLC